MSKLVLAIILLVTVITCISLELYINSKKYPNFTIFATNFITGYTLVWNPLVSTIGVICLLVNLVYFYFLISDQENDISEQRRQLVRYSTLLQEYNTANLQLYNELLQTKLALAALRQMG